MRCRFKYQWCTLFGEFPSLSAISRGELKPSSHVVERSEAGRVESVLSKIHDVLYVLRECLSTELSNRQAMMNLLKSGLRASNQWLRSKNFYVFEKRGVDDLSSSKACFYSYTKEDVEKDAMLREVVLCKFLICAKLNRIQFYNKLLAEDSLPEGLNLKEFARYTRRPIRELALQFAQEGKHASLRKLFLSFPQLTLPYRYEIVSRFPLVSDPSSYFRFLPAFGEKEAAPSPGVFSFWDGRTIQKINTLNYAEVEWFEKREILGLLQPQGEESAIVDEFIAAFGAVQSEAIAQSDFARFAAWIEADCKKIDDATGLTELSKELLQLAISVNSAYREDEAYLRLKELNEQLDLFLLYLKHNLDISYATDLLNDSNPITLSQWVELDSTEIMNLFLSHAGSDFIQVIQLLDSRYLLQQKIVYRYIRSTLEADPSKVALFVDYIQYFIEHRMNSALSKDLTEFVDFFQSILFNDSLAKSGEMMTASLEVCSHLQESSLLQSDQRKQLTLLAQLISLYSQLAPSLSNFHLSKLRDSFLEAEAWIQSNPIDFNTASSQQIESMLELPLLTFVSDAAQSKLGSSSPKEVDSLVSSLFLNSLSFFPKGTKNYIMLRVLLRNRSPDALNAASDLTHSVQQDWMNFTVLHGVDEGMKSMSW